MFSPPQSLEHLKYQQECQRALSTMDGWEQFRNFFAQLGIIAGFIILFGIIEPHTSSAITGLLYLPVCLLCVALFYGIASLIKLVFDR